MPHAQNTSQTQLISTNHPAAKGPSYQDEPDENQEVEVEQPKEIPVETVREKKVSDSPKPIAKASPLPPAQVKTLAEARRDTKSGAREREDGEILVGTMAGRTWLIERRIAAGC